MTALPPRAAAPRVAIAALALTLIVGGCAPDAATPTGAASAGAGSGAAASGPTIVPGGPASPVVGATVGPPATTQTEFGTIYDALPPSFPKLPGQEPAVIASGPTSGSVAAKLSVSDARKIIEVSLISQGWRVSVGSPLEDGTVVLEATGAPADCRTEVRLTPMSGTVIMSVLYGASCPFS